MFTAGMKPTDETVLPAAGPIRPRNPRGPSYLIPRPEDGSACKRMNLYLRWMVRKDAVDPGGWKDVPKSKLVVPLDTHMAKIAGRWASRRGSPQR